MQKKRVFASNDGRHQLDDPTVIVSGKKSMFPLDDAHQCWWNSDHQRWVKLYIHESRRDKHHTINFVYCIIVMFVNDCCILSFPFLQHLIYGIYSHPFLVSMSLCMYTMMMNIRSRLRSDNCCFYGGCRSWTLQLLCFSFYVSSDLLSAISIFWIFAFIF